jgi:hypothetical protein
MEVYFMLDSIRSFLTPEMVAILIPILIAEVMLIAFCVVKILKEGVANLNKGLWLVIVVVTNLVGCIAFLIFGRRRDL